MSNNHTNIFIKILILINIIYSNNSFAANEFKVLSIDGGGVRGIIAAKILQEIEQRANQPISSMFDLMAGTSTGGIIVAGLNVPKDQKPTYSAKDIVNIYQTRSKDIFHRSLFRKLYTGWGSIGARYSRDGLDAVLEDIFKDSLLSQTLTNILLTSYSLENSDLHLWTTRIIRQRKKEDFYLKDITGATSAAPTYFPPKKFTNSEGKVFYEVDGGIFANNPEMIAISEVMRANPNLDRKDICLISIGTGTANLTDTPINLSDSGAIGWVINANLIDVMMNADTSLYEWTSSILLPNSYRLQVNLPKNLGQMDDTSIKHVNALLKLAEDFIENNSQEIDKIVAKIKTPTRNTKLTNTLLR